jgi:hypothetical protein
MVPVIKKRKMGYITSSYVFYFIRGICNRYISYEGMMPIREGAAENQFIQTKLF